jgi:hypothetical protein
VGDHVRVLQKRVEPLAARRLGDQEGVEGILLVDDEIEKEVAHGHEDDDRVGRDGALAAPKPANRDGRTERQQEDPEEQGAIKAAPHGGEFVGKGLPRFRVVLDVLDGKVARYEGVRHGRDGHGQRGGQEIDRSAPGAQKAFRIALDAEERRHARERGDDK